jgi:hypothetical protein
VYFRARKTSIKSDINLIVQRHSRRAAKKQKRAIPTHHCLLTTAMQLSPTESHDHNKLMRRTRYRSARTHWLIDRKAHRNN